MPTTTQGVEKHGAHLRRRWGSMLGWTALVLDHLKPVRVSLLVLSLAVVVFVGVDQAAELFLVALWTDPSEARYLALLASSAFAGISIWYAGRNAYRLRYPRWPALQDERAAPLRDWLPRILGAAVPMLVALGYGVALLKVPHGPCGIADHCARRSWRALGLVAECVVLIGFFATRRRLLNMVARRYRMISPHASSPSAEQRVCRVRELGTVPCAIYAMVVLLNILVTVVIAQRPEAFDGIGPLAILLIAEAFLCFSGSLICMIGDRRGVPLLSAMLLLSASLHWLHLNDNHKVRQYPAMSTHQHPAIPPADTRPSFDDYANAWLDDRCAGRTSCPVILVSSEGGGIRAAAWTALVLSRLTATVDASAPARGEPLVARYLFAASGVSGGSLGLATYVSLLQQPAPTPGWTLELRAQDVLGHDFLAPTLANTFFVDFTQRWLPGAWLNDRARALTRAWESAARTQGVTAFEQPFSALYQQADGAVSTAAPAMFLNSTTVAEGRRFVQHPFRPIVTPQREAWTAAFDGSSWLDPRIPLSEVVLNSARFTYISPAGTLETSAKNPPIPSRLQLVDGGYFENSGTTTLLEVMHLLRAKAAQRKQTLRFIVIHISNDARINDFVDNHDPLHPWPFYSALCPPAPTSKGDSVEGEAIAPFDALLNTRNARGDYARVQLLNALRPNKADPERGDMLWHFRLCPGNYPIPLGWSISSSVFTELDRQVTQDYPLAAMAKALQQQLSPDPQVSR